ncbi:aldo / keto reductase [Thermoplasma volcanium GSS1]|uniref:Aldo / keto reductase n=1 Tax=Thermoplasma volcanium (strain ATCC 51530 / DSM 4299 / JCM 9571 / NBRC 15438 / GSS1) TaxID=273116 RepID=Q979I4_THEVO|nr:aldo/keto reductase [Thermoplasma volcanium]BAB60319.1 aldo / keto reductase [Thermoplasma volcanium GSS1]
MDCLITEMEYKEFGNTGVKVSSVGIGTYYDPGWMALSRFNVKRDAEKKIQAIRTAIDAGVTLIDTAEIYGSEDLVAKAIEGHNREELFIATKVWINHLRYDKVIKACKASLSRLNTKYVDLYQIHFPSPTANLQETFKAMEKLVDDGLVKFIGVSNFSRGKLEKSMEYVKKYEIVSNQIHYSLKKRDAEEDIVKFCENNGMAVLAWYPLEHGSLVRESDYPSEILARIKAKHPSITPAQIALSYLIYGNKLVFPIPRASNPEHVKENIASVEQKLDQEEIEELRKYFN